jgi:hypothetical protein
MAFKLIEVSLNVCCPPESSIQPETQQRGVQCGEETLTTTFKDRSCKADKNSLFGFVEVDSAAPISCSNCDAYSPLRGCRSLARQETFDKKTPARKTVH